MGRDDAMTFRPGLLGGHDSVKGFRVTASDGRAGRVSWASYAPGESYLVVSRGHLHETHHVVPAGAVQRVDDHTVWLDLTRAAIEELPEQHDPPAPVETWMVDAINRATATRRLGGGP